MKARLVVVRPPATREQDIGGFLDFFLEPVVKIVMHLLHKLFVRKLRKNDFIV